MILYINRNKTKSTKIIFNLFNLYIFILIFHINSICIHIKIVFDNLFKALI